ncbi:MAG: hypothetical protein HFF44_07255 [Lawsonibacter sp.]|nr:hypothetical protein [Lawsonibacter sp.]
MKKWLCGGAYLLLWLSAACTGLLALICASKWWELGRYLEKYGIEENLYAEEDHFLLGLFAGFLLILFLGLLAAALGWRRSKKWVKPKDENTTAE